MNIVFDATIFTTTYFVYTRKITHNSHKTTNVPITVPLPWYFYHSSPYFFTMVFLPYHGIFTVPRYFYRTTVFLPYHGIFTIPQYFYRTTVFLPYHGIFTVPRYFYHTTVFLPWYNMTTTSAYLPLRCYGKTAESGCKLRQQSCGVPHLPHVVIRLKIPPSCCFLHKQYQYHVFTV